MSRSVLLFIVYFTFSISFFESSASLSKFNQTKNVIASHAISSMMNQLSVDYSIQWEILAIINDNNVARIEDLVNRIQRKLSVPYNLTVIKQNEQFVTVGADEQCIILKDRQAPLRIVNYVKKKRKEKSFFIFYQGSDFKLSKNFSELAHPRFYEEIYLYNSPEDDSILSFGIEVYNEKCETHLKVLNLFNTSEMKWIHQKFYQTKKYFNNCSISICSAEKNISSVQTLYASYLNSIVLLFVNYSKLSMPEVDSAVCDNDFGDILINVNILHNASFVYMTNVIDASSNTFLVTRGISLTPFEKLILPFDKLTWIFSIMSFCIGYLTIFIIYQFPLFVQKFTFGSKITSPSLTLTQIFFGIGLVKIPGRNFSRFLFAMFTLFCLVIRTAYQGKMFDFLHNDVKHPTVKNLNEMRTAKIPIFHLIDHMKNNVREEEKKKYPKNISGEFYFMTNELTNQIEIVSLDFFVEKINNHAAFRNESFAFLTNRGVFHAGAHFDDLDTMKYFRILDDDYIRYPIMFYVYAESFVAKVFDDFILDIQQHGFCVHLRSKYMKKTPPIAEDDSPQVLTIDKLSAGFLVWIGCVAVACLVFFGELVTFYVQRSIFF